MTGLVALVRRYARAERALCELGIREYESGITEETPAYDAANEESAAAEAAVPGWLRWLTWLIDQRIVRDLDYWRRTGQAS